MSYVDAKTELEILEGYDQIASNLANVSPVCSRSEIIAARAAVSSVHIADSLREAIVNIVQATRESNILQFGASTRAALMLQQAVKAWALVDGRDHATEDDLKFMIPYVLLHRIRFHAGIENPQQALQELAAAPMEKLIAAVG
jgi:MoxR-like ATPase